MRMCSVVLPAVFLVIGILLLATTHPLEDAFRCFDTRENCVACSDWNISGGADFLIGNCSDLWSNFSMSNMTTILTNLTGPALDISGARKVELLQDACCCSVAGDAQSQSMRCPALQTIVGVHDMTAFFFTFISSLCLLVTVTIHFCFWCGCLPEADAMMSVRERVKRIKAQEKEAKAR